MTDIVQRLRTGTHRMCASARLDPLRVDRPCDPCSERLDAADEIERLRVENAAFRNAIRVGDGPSCEDVCLVECVGVCGITFEESPC